MDFECPNCHCEIGTGDCPLDFFVEAGVLNEGDME